jgi:hypothetical protein
LQLLINTALKYAIWNAQASEEAMKFNVTHHLLVYATDDYLLGRNMNTINKNTKTLLVASKEFDLELNAKKTKYMFMV